MINCRRPVEGSTALDGKVSMASLLWDVPRRKGILLRRLLEEEGGTRGSLSLASFWTWQLAEGGLELRPLKRRGADLPYTGKDCSLLMQVLTDLEQLARTCETGEAGKSAPANFCRSRYWRTV